MSSPLKVAMVVAAVSAAAAAVGVVSIRSALRHAGSSQDTGPSMTAQEMADIVSEMHVAPFTGVDHRGRPFDQSIFTGHWTIVTFGFTHCTLVCPMLHGQIYRASDILAPRGIRFLTISVDPAHDTVEQMAAYMKDWNVQNDVWTFARLEPDAIASVLAGLKMPNISDDPRSMIDLPGGGQMANVQHTTRFFVIGPDATVQSLWSGSDPAQVDAMIRWLLVRVRPN